MKRILLFCGAALMCRGFEGCAPAAVGLPLVYEVENRAAGMPLPPLPEVGELPAVAALPDPFEWSDGSGRVEKLSDWTRRRGEIVAEIQHYELGAKPPRPENLSARWSPADSTLTVVMMQGVDTVVLRSKVELPRGEGLRPVVIGMNRPTGSLPAELFDDFIRIPFVHDQVSLHSGPRDARKAVYRMFPQLLSSGNYAAWSWGISRLVDGLVLVAEEMGADARRIVLTGCSYAGKMALFGCAFDERIALTVVQESGGGGVNSWRVSDGLGNVEKIANTNYDWFLPSLRDGFNGRAERLPYDHHELIAAIAPRPVLILGNPDYEWMADESGYISTVAALEVWRAMGVPERLGYDFSPGHPHCAVTDSQRAAVTAFLDRFIRRGGADTSVRGQEGSEVSRFGRGEPGAAIRTAPVFDDVDCSPWIPWSGHKLRE